MLSRRDVLFVLGALPAMTFAAESTAENYDVIVVGSGAAGLSAAVSAAQNGSKRVLVLEKTPTLGGHTILSTGYMSVLVHDGADEATYTKAVERIMEVFLKTGEGRGNPQLVRQLVEKSEDAHQWLSSLGLVWTPQSYQTLAGLTSRSFIPSLVRAGYDYIVTLNKAARMHGVTTLLNAEAMILGWMQLSRQQQTLIEKVQIRRLVTVLSSHRNSAQIWLTWTASKSFPSGEVGSRTMLVPIFISPGKADALSMRGIRGNISHQRFGSCLIENAGSLQIHNLRREPVAL